MKKIRLFFVGLLLFTLILSMTVHGAPIVLNYWNGFTGPDGKTMQKIVDEFNAANKDKVEVHMSVMQWGDFYQKIVTAAISGKAPEVCTMHLDRMPEFAAKGVLLPVDGIAKKYGFKSADFVKSTWDGGVYQGKRYSLPLDTHPMVMYWNKKLFKEAGLDPEKPPTDYVSFVKDCKAIEKDTDGDGKIDRWGTMLAIAWPNYHYWYSIFYQNGGVLFNPNNTKANFDSQAGVNAMQIIYDLIYKDKVSPTNVQTDSEHAAFKRGELGITFNGIWMLNDYKTTPNLDFGCGMIPQFGSKKLAVWADSHQFCIPKQKNQDPKKVELAGQFIKYISEHSLEWGFGGQIPARLSVLNSTEYQGDKYLSSISKEAQYVVFPSFFPKYGPATQPVWDALNAMMLNKISPTEAGKNATELGNKILAQ